MYYLERTGSHEEMGAALGRQFRQRCVSFPLHLDDFQLEHGRRSEEILQRFFPEVCAEIQGLCDAVGAEYPSFVAWLLCMGCCMYNLEDNLPAEVRGCTAFACAKGGKILYAGTTTCRPACATNAGAKSTRQAVGTAFISPPPPSSMGRKV